MSGSRQPWPDGDPFRVLEEGWDHADFHQRFRPILDRMVADRGWIINSYAQIEFIAADLIEKCRIFPEYEQLTARIPFGLGQRVERLEQLCAFGPLAPHAANILPLMHHLLSLEETRHHLIHGFGTFHIQKDGRLCAMHFRRFAPLPKGQHKRTELLILPDDMEIERGRWTRFAQSALAILRGVYRELQLEAHDVTAGKPDVLR